MGDNEWGVAIGEVIAPFGLKGEVKVLSLTDSPEQFAQAKEVFVGKDETHGRVFRIESARPHKGGFVAKFAGVDDISKAELLRGATIFIRKTDLAPLEENEYYIRDLIGLEVVTTEGRSLGTIKEVLQSPANDVYITDQAMIPAVKEFVVSIDLGERKMVVKPIEGLENES